MKQDYTCSDTMKLLLRERVIERAKTGSFSFYILSFTMLLHYIEGLYNLMMVCLENIMKAYTINK